MLIVQDPSNPTTDANSYVSITGARNRAVILGVELPADDTKAESGLFQAKQYVDSRCFNGKTVIPFQGTEMPRTGLYIDGNEYPSDQIPQDIIDAQIIAAAAAGEGSLWPSGTTGTGIKRKKVSSLEIEYFEGATSSSVTKVNRADGLLYKYTCSSSNGVGNDYNFWYVV